MAYETLPHGLKIPDTLPVGSAGVVLADNFRAIDKSIGGYVHDQSVPAATWRIEHNLGKPVSVTCATAAGVVVTGEMTIVDLNVVEVRYYAGGVPLAIAGTAYVV